MPEQITQDLNTVIATAVSARIEAEVAAALSGDAVMSKYVAAALQQEIEVRDGGYSGYSSRNRKTTFLRQTIDTAIRQATETAVRKVIAEEQEALEAAVATELRRQTKDIAKTLVGQVAEVAQKSHGVRVELVYPSRY